MESLLGQFYNRIKGSQEDIASESLAYILKKSARARQTINQIVNLTTGLTLTDLLYKTQRAGEQLERPDISGINEKGEEVLLIEAKFWASLTNNQPNTYIKRLKNNSVLIFLVPSLRIRSIYEEVMHRIRKELSPINVDHKSYTITINSKYVIIKSWSEILNAIKSELLQENNQELVSDINQIIGFCETIDNNSFQPIQDEDLAPGIPKKIVTYYSIIDKVVDEIKNRNTDASTKGLQKTPQKYGYHRYLTIGDFGIGMCLRLDLWAEYAETPFWVAVAERKDDWTSSERFKRAGEKIAFHLGLFFVEGNNDIFLSLHPQVGVTEDILINNLADQIELIYNEIQKEFKPL